ncbi:hypothetical protein BO79DRAFT_43872 [Aspergillus costaricaensis CBS 115574]|uniref:Uncharacterized protein n=1 Tax=Aspergillus costaricaensis CBS 115574 TaxID=1448317 RepID=A0ACD1IR84_9EURO|nr:hypothetical protein BO79DRAFT_43872 [Aspergillus costaricaensis CBS 115574]RAK93206.1 hypothetical protein BO79DRAFT_43872 [Aspergillus costaricaensis CBS 115574]
MFPRNRKQLTLFFSFLTSKPSFVMPNNNMTKSKMSTVEQGIMNDGAPAHLDLLPTATLEIISTNLILSIRS